MKNKAIAILPYLVIIVLGVILVTSEYDYLARVEEQNLFMHTPYFFKQCMVVSGGMLSWVGAFLTQLLHYPVLGVGVLCLLWYFLVLMLRVTFHIPRRWMMVAVIPVAMLLLADVDLGYWIFYLKLRGHFFVATLGILIAVVLVLAYRVLPKYLRTVFVALAVACGYPLFGIYALFAALLMAVMAWRIDGYYKGLAATDTLVAIVAVCFVPLLCYRHVFHQTNMEYIYTTALPLFSMRQENYNSYYIPYAVVALTLLCLAMTYKSIRQQKEGNGTIIQSAILVALAVVLAFFWYKDANFHNEIVMRKCVDNQDWEGVLKVAKKADEPTRDMWMMKNLALTRLGRLGEEMYDYPNGAKAANCPFPTRMVQWDGKTLYIQYGIPNYCYRWCMEDGVEYGWRVDELKLMVKCSIANAEWAAAQKYVSMLKKTLFHKAWAKRFEQYIQDPRKMINDKEMMGIVSMMTDDNYLSGDNAAVERFLIEHFAGSESKNPYVQEQALVAAMMTRNPDIFWLRFFQYTELHKTERVPTLYQQAACLFGGLDDKVDASNMPFDKQVVDDCRDFMDTLKQYREQGMDMEQIKHLMQGRFGSTYFFDYFFNRYQEEIY